MTHASPVFARPGHGLALLLACVLAAPPGAAEAAEPSKTKNRDSTVGKVTFTQAPSQESAAAREKRLKRECKGRPNAGMCLGHTR